MGQRPKVLPMNRFFGNKQFYRTVLAVTVPIAIQNAISNFISLLDNVMVGQVGTEQMSGVTIVNRCVIGAGSVVTKDIPDDSVAVGNPARVVRKQVV